MLAPLLLAPDGAAQRIGVEAAYAQCAKTPLPISTACAQAALTAGADAP